MKWIDAAGSLAAPPQARSQMKKLFPILIIVVLQTLSITTIATATPNLGVATSVYAYTGPVPPTDPWINYFADDLVQIGGEDSGFVLGPSGSELIVFTDLIGYDIYLLTDSDVGINNAPAYGGTPLEVIPYETGQADGYKPTPYYAVLLPDTGWEPISGAEGLEGYYMFTAELTYEGVIPLVSYFFAAADVANPGGELHFNSSIDDPNTDTDPFSPKTSSASPIPEPSSLLLISSGLLGLGLFGRARFRRS